MNRWLLSACVAVLLVLGVWLSWKLFPNDKEVIRARLQELARKTSFAPGEGLLSKTAKASQVAELFSPDVTVQFTHAAREQLNLTGRADIIQALNQAHLHMRGLAVEFVDLLVSLEADKLSATALVTAKAQISGEREFYLHELKLALKKADGQWLITKVEDFKTLER